MTVLDPDAAVSFALATTRWRASGLCLEFVDHCYGVPTSQLGDNGGPPNGAWQEAKDGWYYSEHQHPGDSNPPPGVPCYWETGPSGNAAGHIVISLGDGWCRTTDYAGAASVSTQTIDSITAARRGGYLGWTEDYGGNPIAGISTPAALDELLIPQEDDMKKFIIRSTNGKDPWFITDGLTRRQLTAEEIDLMVQLGVAEKSEGPDKPNGVNVIGDYIDRIPDITVR